jgi:NADH-quinone oxidoreductase subunit G
LAETSAQWPIIGQRDFYYGGTAHENKQGLGVQLTLKTPVAIPSSSADFLRPDEDQPLAVPVTRLYDRGITVITSNLLHAHIGEAVVLLHPETARKFGIASGHTVMLNGFPAVVGLDDAVPASVVLVPRSMGFPVQAPLVAELKKA